MGVLGNCYLIPSDLGGGFVAAQSERSYTIELQIDAKVSLESMISRICPVFGAASKNFS